MRNHLRKLLPKLLLGAIAITIPLACALWFLARPGELEFDFNGPDGQTEVWEQAFRNDDLLIEWLAWRQLDDDARKPYFSITVTEKTAREGSLARVVCNLQIASDDVALAAFETALPADVLAHTKPRLARETMQRALTTAIAKDTELLRRVADEGLQTPFAKDYAAAIAAAGPAAAAAAPALARLAITASDADLQIIAAKAARLIVPPDSADYPELAAELLTAPNPDVHRLALDGLAANSTPAAVTVLANQALVAPDEPAAHAITQLIHLGPAADAARPSLAQILTDPQRSPRHRRLAALAIAATTTASDDLIATLQNLAIDPELPAPLRQAARTAAFTCDLRNSTWTLAAEIIRTSQPKSPWDPATPPRTIKRLNAKLTFQPLGKLAILNLDTNTETTGSWHSNGHLFFNLPALDSPVSAPVNDYHKLTNLHQQTNNGTTDVLTWTATRDQ